MSLSNKEKKILDNHREILWLKRQIEEYEREDKIELPDLSEQTDENIENGIDMYRNHINSMRAQLDIVTLRNKNREEIGKAIDECYFIAKTFYDKGRTEREKEIKKATRKSLNKRDEYLSEFMEVYETYDKLKSELSMLQGESAKKHKELQELTTKSLALQQEIENITMTGQIKVLHESKIEQTNYNAAIRGILNNLLLVTNIEWETDQKLLELMTRLGEDVLEE